MKKNLLMSYNKYAAMKHDTPYLYTHTAKGQVIYYFGAKHSHDPHHSQFDLLKKHWSDFFERTKRLEQVVIVETPKIWEPENTIEESVIKYGEVGAGIFLGESAQVLIAEGEPQENEVIMYLLENFSKEEILLWYQSQAIKFWYLNKRGKTIHEFLSGHTEKYRKLLKWPELVISADFIGSIYKQMFNQELDFNDKEIFYQITTPVHLGSRLNILSRSQSLYRNKHMLDQVSKYWEKEYNIFIIYGASHAVMQESAIRSLVA